jgi:hypothetical protein
MESIPRKPCKANYHFSLALLGLACLVGTADARPMLLPSEQFPGPWLEVTQEIRDILTLNKVSACSQAPRGANLRLSPANISCTAQRTRSFGQAGAYSQRHAPFEAPAGSSKVSHRRTAIKAWSGVAMSNAAAPAQHQQGDRLARTDVSDGSEADMAARRHRRSPLPSEANLRAADRHVRHGSFSDLRAVQTDVRFCCDSGR